MNKLLTTITLLCFSVAANADIYFCEETAEGRLFEFDSAYAEKIEAQKFILDTDLGWRRSDITFYIAPCEIDRDGLNQEVIVCTDETDLGNSTFSIRPADLTFSLIYHDYGLGFLGFIGTCIKA